MWQILSEAEILNWTRLGILAGIINGIGVALQILLPKFFAKEYDRDTLLVYGFLGAAFVLLFGMDLGDVATHISKNADDKFTVGFIWNWNSLYNGSKCCLRKINAVCGGYNDKYTFCFGSCYLNYCRIFCFP